MRHIGGQEPLTALVRQNESAVFGMHVLATNLSKIVRRNIPDVATEKIFFQLRLSFGLLRVL